jgi:Domain of unknown function (DUF4395)
MSVRSSAARIQWRISTGEPLGASARLRRVFSFPDPVNEVSARLVAAGVIAMIVSGQFWLTAVIAYGFVARVLSGPTLSPLGMLVTRVITPLLHVPERPVAGPPKRFAQAIGAVFSLSAAVLALGVGETTAADGVLGALTAAAALESGFGICLGCRAFALLVRAGAIPAGVCERCQDLTAPRSAGWAAARLPRAPGSRAPASR